MNIIGRTVKLSDFELWWKQSDVYWPMQNKFICTFITANGKVFYPDLFVYFL